MPAARPVKVAIIGGGCGSLAAAFELTRPSQRKQYQVTIYQMGWRLGGKGASGRGPRARIEEHALHVWLGFYENAFRLLRDCHTELGTPTGWRDDFVEDSFVALARSTGATAPGDRGQRVPSSAWAALFPPVPGMPGDPLVGPSNPFSLGSYMVQALRLLRSLLVGVAYLEQNQETGQGFADPQVDDLDNGEASGDEKPIARILAIMTRLMKLAFLSSSAGLLRAVNVLEAMTKQFATTSKEDRYFVVEFVEALAKSVRMQLGGVLESDPAFAFRWQVVDLVLAIILGSLRDGLLTDPRGLDAINDIECREWLLRHGASEQSVNGEFVRGLYNLGFANEAGIAAGQALRGALRMFFTYRGALFWKMRAGMGDVVFTPLYEVLRRRGVKFQFFHRLENVQMSFPSGDSAFVSGLEFDLQARVREGAEYSPLVEVKNRRCWPSSPDYSQLENGDALKGVEFESFLDRRRVEKLRLEVEKDFDLVVLGTSVGAVPHVCGEILVNRGPIGAQWRAMVKNVVTTATQAFQLWLRKDLSSLGWHEQSVTLSALMAPFDTWADMRQVVPSEAWPERHAPRSVAYFCGPLRDDAKDLDRPPAGDSALDHPRARQTEVKANAIRFLGTHMARLWTGASNSDGFRWEMLVDPLDTTRQHKNADEGMQSQFWTANINPSDRYVLAKAGTLKHRISPLDPSIDNLTIAGDWTDCGFNEGCVEAAIMSGRLASHAISTLPRLEEIVGYDHP